MQTKKQNKVRDQRNADFRSVVEVMPNEVDKRRLKVKDRRAFGGGTTWSSRVTLTINRSRLLLLASAWATLTRQPRDVIGCGCYLALGRWGDALTVLGLALISLSSHLICVPKA